MVISQTKLPLELIVLIAYLEKDCLNTSAWKTIATKFRTQNLLVSVWKLDSRPWNRLLTAIGNDNQINPDYRS